MILDKLPLEVLHLILGFVGPSQLQQQEACTLTVSRWWYNVAKPIVLEELSLTSNQLILLPQYMYEDVTRFTRRVTLHIHSVEDQPNRENPHSDIEEQKEAKWERALVNHLEKFSVLLLRCAGLNNFTFQAHSHFDPRDPLAPRQEYLSTWSPAGLIDNLPTSKLTELVIDTCGSEIADNIHVCPHAVRQIPRLRSVRIRMRRICPEILDIDQTTEDPTKSSNIESLIFNLSLIEPDRLSAGFSHHCTEGRRGWELFDDMVTAGSEAAKRLPSIKVLRVLCHKHPSQEIVVRDCITGTKTILPGEGEWDWGDDGEPDPDDQDFSDQGFSDFSDLSNESDHIN